MIGHSRRALRRGARGNAPSAAVSTVPPTRHVRCVYLTLFGSGLAGLGGRDRRRTTAHPLRSNGVRQARKEIGPSTAHLTSLPGFQPSRLTERKHARSPAKSPRV